MLDIRVEGRALGKLWSEKTMEVLDLDNFRTWVWDRRRGTHSERNLSWDGQGHSGRAGKGRR